MTKHKTLSGLSRGQLLAKLARPGSIAHQVRQLRGERNQENMAAAANVGRTHWVAIESGEKVPNVATLRKMCRALGGSIVINGYAGG